MFTFTENVDDFQQSLKICFYKALVYVEHSGVYQMCFQIISLSYGKNDTESPKYRVASFYGLGIFIG